VVLDVFRDASYPVGVGTFDAHVVPLRGHVTAADVRGDRLDVRAEVERVARFQRSYVLERVAVGGAHAGQDDARPRCRYVIVAPGGNAVRAGSARFDDAGIARVPLAGLRASGTYTVMMAVAVGANLSNPDVKTVQWSSSSSTP
jgi:hypothetical protein